MIIANYQVQNTLRAYGQQLADRSRMAKIKTQKTLPPKDQVNFSTESKKKLMAERITNQIINQFIDGSEMTDTHREILRQLSREYKGSIQIEGKEGQGLAFRVLDGGPPGAEGYLAPDESEKLKKKLFEITHSIVYNNLS